MTANDVPSQVSSSRRLIDLRGSPRLIRTELPLWDDLVGGWAGGMMVFLAGSPGSGKTTLCLKILDIFKGVTLYASTEEMPGELTAAREKLRLRSERVHAVFTREVTEILAEAEHLAPAILVINSASSAAVGVQRATQEIYSWTQKHRHTMSIVTAHLSWKGHAAGPRYLEHNCDAVLYCTIRSEPVETSAGRTRTVRTRWIELRKGRPPLNGVMAQAPIPDFS